MVSTVLVRLVLARKRACVCVVTWAGRLGCKKEFSEQTDFETQKPTISWIAEEVLLKITRISCARYAWKPVLCVRVCANILCIIII